jgi:hypothetical protein
MVGDETSLSLLAIILEMILYIALHRQIGLKYSKDLGKFFFGIIARKVELKTLGNLLEFLDSSTTNSKSLPIKSIKPCKNSNPLGLKILSF